MRRQTAVSIFSGTPYRCKILSASAGLSLASTVGPLPIAPSGLPTTSLRMRLMQADGAAARANPPPFTSSRWRRTVFSSCIEQPLASSTSVSRCQSPSASSGRVSRADAPPEMRNSTRSFLVVFASRSKTRVAAATLSASETGWAAGKRRSRSPSTQSPSSVAQLRSPFLGTITAPSMASASSSSTAFAIGTAALPTLTR